MGEKFQRESSASKKTLRENGTHGEGSGGEGHPEKKEQRVVEPFYQKGLERRDCAEKEGNGLIFQLGGKSWEKKMPAKAAWGNRRGGNARWSWKIREKQKSWVVRSVSTSRRRTEG